MLIKSRSISKKIWLVMAIFILTSFSLFAYDGTVYGGSDGNFTRFNWINQASSLNLARSVVDAHRGNLRIERIFSIGEDDVDMEDVMVINDMEAYIINNFRVGNGDGFSHLVVRGNQGRGWDGWVIFSHYSNTQGWLHYMYYFLLQ